MRNVPPFTQNGRMRIISAFPFGPTGRYSALRIQRYGCRPLAGPEGRLVACANGPGLARRLPCGLCRPARSHARAHARSWHCAYAALVCMLQLRMCTCTWAWRGLRVSSAAHCAYKPFVRAPRRPCAGECGIRPGPCAGCCSRCAPAYATIAS
jgi:hypothetical protein